MFTFPEKLKKTTLTYKEKRVLRKKKLAPQLTSSNISFISASSSSSSASQAESNTYLVKKRPLPTINELTENVDDEAHNANSDSISNKVAANTNNIFSIEDTMSTNFSSVATQSATSLSYNDNHKSSTNESTKKILNASNKNNNDKWTFKEKLKLLELKVIGIYFNIDILCGS